MEIIVGAGESGKRIDSYIAERSDLTRSAVVNLIEKGNITINGKTV